MPVRLNFTENIQNVIIADSINGEEAETLRQKLDEKINQGRALISFDLLDLNFDIKTSVENLEKIINHCIQTGGTIALVGAKSEKMPSLSNSKVDFFSTRESAAKWLTDKALEEQKNEEERKNHLATLIQKYEKFFSSRKEPRLDLQSLFREYEANPSLEILWSYEKARLLTEATKVDVESLRKVTAAQAEEMMSLSLFRKAPRASNEIVDRKNELAREQAQIETQIAEVEDRIRHYITMTKSLKL